MFRKIVLLFVATLMVACDSEGDSGSNSGGRISSSLVVDGISFEPATASYRYNPVEPGDLHKTVTLMLGRTSPLQSMTFLLYLPLDKTDLAGAYSFGPGEAHELLCNGTFVADPKFYSIVGTTMTVTELGNSRLKLTFQNPVALDIANGFSERPMSGEVQGKFVLLD